MDEREQINAMWARDEKQRAKLASMWTPAMFDRFENDLRELFKMADPQFLALTTEEYREEIIATLKQRAKDHFQAPQNLREGE